jgi:competence ComEA-like helix-hairpin-helix protein
MSLKQSDLLVLFSILAISLSLGFFQIAHPTPLTVTLWQAPKVTVTNLLSSTDRIDLNRATYDELISIPEITPTLAEEILQYREEHSFFKNLEELLNLRGVNEKLFEELKQHLKLSAPEEEQE